VCRRSAKLESTTKEEVDAIPVAPVTSPTRLSRQTRCGNLLRCANQSPETHYESVNILQNDVIRTDDRSPTTLGGMLTSVAPRLRPELAPREKEVLVAWILHDNKDDVASHLQISTTTVRTHLQRIRDKYAAAGRPATTKAALVARAIQDGLIDVNDL
jgi:DNA-binding CsgD family transcriptional regulator